MEAVTAVVLVALFVIILLAWLLSDTRRSLTSARTENVLHTSELSNLRAISERRRKRIDDLEGRLHPALREVERLRPRAEMVDRLELLVADLGRRSPAPAALVLRIGFAGDTIATQRSTEPPSSFHSSQGDLDSPLQPILDVL